MNTNKLAVGILAHVDAGKTTLAESILYLTKSIRRLGRVDHKDAFLDTYELERARGITIFSKQAEVKLGDKEVTLLDTPGHIDFSSEMERTLQVLDYTILVINGADGVQGHTQTLWRLLKKYEIPTFLFINKMDQVGTDKDKLLVELTRRLDERCIDFSKPQNEEMRYESIAMCDEEVMESYLETGVVEKPEIANLIKERKVFPCYFGSALKMEGVEEFLKGFDELTKFTHYPEEFGTKVFKITRDNQGNRLTYMKITGGSLKVKMPLTNKRETASMNRFSEEEIWEEKADQIRIYSGGQFETVNEAKAGSVCAVTGLSKTYAGQGLGIEENAELPILKPVLTYQIKLPLQSNVHMMFTQLKQLQEEDPQLQITWHEQLNEIHVKVMGDIQIEILKSMILERFGIEVEFDSGSIVYKETIEKSIEGVGHFEPLRHYAEVHLLMEPLPRESGLQFGAECSEDMLDKNWQRLVLTHLTEKSHIGVLTGSEITDMRITLVAGKSHQKHTEGGDFRQATYRALRQGLKMTESILLEPVYEFRLEIPVDMIGRALSDIQRMYGYFDDPQIEGEMAIITGYAPVVTMRGYQTEIISYTKGHGRMFSSLKGYEVCHNQEEVIAQIGYDSEKDLENPASSVFCSHGAGFTVEWDKVYDYMHVQSNRKEKEHVSDIQSNRDTLGQASIGYSIKEDKELEKIFERTYGAVKQKRNNWSRTVTIEETKNYESKPKKNTSQEEYLLVDGYNIIFAWEDLRELSKVNIESARDKLMDILSNYQGYKKNTLILVFDAYKVEGNTEEVIKYNGIQVIYTKEAETADQYIERLTHKIARKYNVTVATSDALEQMIIWGQGAYRLSANGLREEIEATNEEIRKNYLNRNKKSEYLFDGLSDELTNLVEDVRLGKKTFK